MSSEKGAWLLRMGWSKNPFSLDIRPELFVGCSDVFSKIEEGLRSSQKYLVVLGPTGAGKTTLLRKLSLNHPSFYLPKPPATKEELLHVLDRLFFGIGLLRGLFGPKNTTLYNFAEHVNKKFRGSPPVLLIDEAHESGIDVLEWLRSLIDQIDGQSVVFAGLSSFKTSHLDRLETLSQRVTISTSMPTLTKDETFELIRRRIESVGGHSIDPFTSDAVSAIFSKTGGFPREVIKLCNSLVLAAQSRDASIIDPSYLDEETTFSQKFNAEELLSNLTKKQMLLLQLLSKSPLTPTDIVSRAKLSGYKTKAHALRGVNNMLRRLESAGLVYRVKRGKRYIYSLEPKIKTLFVKA